MIKRRKAEGGQAAVEFVFSLLLLAAFTAVLFQALHFELDVFNKSAGLRYRSLMHARENQERTEPELLRDVRAQGKDIRNLTFFTVPLQDVDLSLHYGPKRLVIRHGTRYWDPSPIHSQGAFEAALLFDHYEDSAGYIGGAFEYVWDFLKHIPL